MGSPSPSPSKMATQATQSPPVAKRATQSPSKMATQATQSPSGGADGESPGLRRGSTKAVSRKEQLKKKLYGSELRPYEKGTVVCVVLTWVPEEGADQNMEGEVSVLR